MMELCKSESDEETLEAEEKSELIQQEVSEITNNETDVIPEKTNNTAECAENKSITDIDAADNDIAYSQMIENESAKKNTEEDNLHSKEVINEKPAPPGITTNDQQEDTSKKVINEKPTSPGITTNDQHEDTEKNDSNSDFKLVYNDSVEEEHLTTDNTESVPDNDTLQKKAENDLENHSEQQLTKVNTEPESQLISLHYTENNTEELVEIDKTNEPEKQNETEKPADPSNEITEIVNIAAEEDKQDDFFSDDDVNMEDIDRIIENAEILRGMSYFCNSHCSALVRWSH